ncbi:MAG: DUF2283 domain-containing protein [Candidatus Omnitrophica bacterium]|nr:DUF2283 domain-containing protein [Candidatus Omnitrophota bacterium]
MKITYDKEADALYIQFQPEKEVKETIEIREGILCDIDKEGRLFGIEILQVSKRFPLEELGKLNIDFPIYAS